MKLNKLKTALMALAVSAALTSAAEAQVDTLYHSGDLLLGFEQNGNASNYLVDLGQVSQFINATSPLTFDLSTTDLSTIFGSSWASNSQTNLVQWGVAGNDRSVSDQTNLNAVWYTQVQPSTAPVGGSSGVQKQVSLSIQALETGLGGYQGGTSTVNSNAAIVQSSSAANSWSSFSPSNGIGFNLGTGVETLSGPTNSSLDLYQVLPGSTGTLLGDFSLSSGGVLTFTQATPEPSSYALGLTAVILFVVLRRRSALSSAI